MEEAKLLIPFLKNLGNDILEIYKTDFDYESKADDSPLTKADLLSHTKVTNFLKENFPLDEIISEEDETPIDNSNGRVWIVDPLDGTKDFIQKTDEFSVMIALLENKLPIFGIVYLPAKDMFYYAKKNEGSFKLENGIQTKISVSNQDNLENYRLVRSRNHFREEDQKVADSLKISNYVKSGSVGIKFGLIAQGLAEICFYTTSKMGIWDDAPAHIILEEAGGCVFDVNGETPSYDLTGRKMKFGFIGCTNSKNKEIILDSIKKSL